MFLVCRKQLSFLLKICMLEHLLIRKAVGVELFPLTSVKTNCVCVCVCVCVCLSVGLSAYARASVVMFLEGLIHKLAKMEMFI